MKSLDKLRSGKILEPDEKPPIDSQGVVDMGKMMSNLADEIQAEIDRYYLPLPILENGEPVQHGDIIDLGKGFMFIVTGVEYHFGVGVTLIGANDQYLNLISDERLYSKNRLKNVE